MSIAPRFENSALGQLECPTSKEKYATVKAPIIKAGLEHGKSL